MLLLLEHQDCKKNIRRETNSSGTVRGTMVLCAQQQCLSCCIWIYIFNLSVPQHPTLNIHCSFLALLSSYFPFQTPFSEKPPTIQPITMSSVHSQERAKSSSWLGLTLLQIHCCCCRAPTGQMLHPKATLLRISVILTVSSISETPWATG